MAHTRLRASIDGLSHDPSPGWSPGPAFLDCVAQPCPPRARPKRGQQGTSDKGSAARSASICKSASSISTGVSGPTAPSTAYPSLFGLGGHLTNEFRNGSAGLVDHTAEDPVFSRQRARKSAQFRSYVHRAILYWASLDPATAVQHRAIGR